MRKRDDVKSGGGRVCTAKVQIKFKYGPHWSKGQEREYRDHHLFSHTEENRRARVEQEVVPYQVCYGARNLSRLDLGSAGSGLSGRGL